MARTKNTPAEPLDLAPLPEQKITEQQNLVARVEAAYSDERDLANQILGQIQMSRAISKFTDVVSLQKLLHIKETKMYRALAGKKGIDRQGNEIPDVGTFDGFCRALGTSASKVDEDLTNLRIFGEDALEQLTQIGAGYRELRQYRRLPEDQKAALIEVAKAGDKEAFVELAEEIIAKHAKEKEELTKKATEAESTLDASRQRSAEKSAELEQVREENIRLTRHRSSIDPIELGTEIREALAAEITRVETELLTLRATLATLVKHSQEHAINHDAYMAGMLCQLERTLNQLRGEFDIPSAVDGSGKPEWLGTGAEE